MNRINLKIARRLVLPTTNKKYVTFPDAGVPEILKTIFMAGQIGPSFTKGFADRLRGRNDYETLRNVWQFVKYNIEYKRDKPGKERVKSPGKLLYDGVGDCKSFTTIIISILTNLNIPWRYRVAFYDPKNPQSGHIYPIATIKGREVVVDAVYNYFDQELQYWKAEDYSPHGVRLSSLSGMPSKTSNGSLLKLALAGIGAIIFLKLAK